MSQSRPNSLIPLIPLVLLFSFHCSTRRAGTRTKHVSGTSLQSPNRGARHRIGVQYRILEPMTSTVSASGSDSIYQWFPKQLEAMGSAEILKSHSRNTEYTIHHNNYQIIPNPKDLLPMSNFFVPREMIVW